MEETEGGGGFGTSELFLITVAGLLVFAIVKSIKIIPEYEKAVILRLGQISGDRPKGPGIFICIPFVDECVKVDMRMRAFDVPPQQIITKDSVSLMVDGVLYLRVMDAIAKVTKVQNSDATIKLLAQTSLRNMLGSRTLAEILSEKDAITHDLLKELDEATDQYGVKVERVELKDMRLPAQLQRTLASEAEASREAKAKVVAADGEMKASEMLKEAGNIMSTSPNAMQLRYLQTLTTISAEKNSTIIFPLPIDLVSALLNKDSMV